MRTLLMALAIAWAGSAGAQAVVPDQKHQLVEQKIKLLEMLLNSPTAKASGAASGGDGPTLIERGRRAVELARAALAEGRIDEAATLVDESLKSSSAQSRRLQSESALSDGAQRQMYQNLREQVATYRAAIIDLTRDPKTAGAARGLLGRIDVLSADAGKQEAGGRLREANQVLTDAYRLAVAEISSLRAGQEVVMSLNFATPAEEYAYEQRRFESGELMVGMLIAEGRAPGERKAQVDAYAGEGRRLKLEAARLAADGRHKEAVGVMEQATVQMNRALQSMGVAVF